jgi:quercetin dioxygenase-like cupin family protein
MLKTIATIAFLALFSSASPLSAQQAPLQPSPVKRTILQKADVPGTNLEMIYATVEIAPGFKAGRHTHPGLVMAQVTDGEFWFAPDGQPETIFKAGKYSPSRTAPSITKARPTRA